MSRCGTIMVDGTYSLYSLGFGIVMDSNFGVDRNYVGKIFLDESMNGGSRQFYSEMYAIFAGLGVAARYGISDLNIVSDCESLVDMYYSGSKHKNKKSEFYISTLRKLLDIYNFEGLTFNWSSSQLNVADNLARSMLSKKGYVDGSYILSGNLCFVDNLIRV